MDQQAFTIDEFAKAHRVSRELVYKMLREGTGPRIFKAGSRTLISIEAAAEWRRQREAAAAPQAA